MISFSQPEVLYALPRAGYDDDLRQGAIREDGRLPAQLLHGARVMRRAATVRVPARGTLDPLLDKPETDQGLCASQDSHPSLSLASCREHWITG